LTAFLAVLESVGTKAAHKNIDEIDTRCKKMQQRLTKVDENPLSCSTTLNSHQKLILQTKEETLLAMAIQVSTFSITF
jgi:hypothetical protein